MQMVKSVRIIWGLKGDFDQISLNLTVKSLLNHPCLKAIIAGFDWKLAIFLRFDGRTFGFLAKKSSSISFDRDRFCH